VLTLVGDEIVSQLEKRSIPEEHDLESCLSELRKLQSGLQVNVSFSGSATSFEKSTGFRIFELLGVKVRIVFFVVVFHDWRQGCSRLAS
jgi:hypothetical protein